MPVWHQMGLPVLATSRALSPPHLELKHRGKSREHKTQECVSEREMTKCQLNSGFRFQEAVENLKGNPGWKCCFSAGAKGNPLLASETACTSRKGRRRVAAALRSKLVPFSLPPPFRAAPSRRDAGDIFSPTCLVSTVAFLFSSLVAKTHLGACMEGRGERPRSRSSPFPGETGPAGESGERTLERGRPEGGGRMAGPRGGGQRRLTGRGEDSKANG